MQMECKWTHKEPPYFDPDFFYVREAFGGPWDLCMLVHGVQHKEFFGIS